MKDLSIVIPFMRYRRFGLAISIVLMLGSITALAVKGLNFALDFTGGTQVQIIYNTAPDLEVIRQTLDEAGFTGNEVVAIGSDTTIQVSVQNRTSDDATDDATESGETAQYVTQLLIDAAGGQARSGGSSFISSQVGDDLMEQGGLGMLVAIIMMMSYIAFRFQFKFAFGAVWSIVHDVLFTLGFMAITQLDFDLNALASILAIIGKSMNDTVVVADRIRENFRLLRNADPERIVDTSLSQTLVRTTITAVTTLLVLFALFFYGGQALYGFSLVLIVGSFIGLYSSIYVASGTLLFLTLSKEDMAPPEKRDAELEAIP
ncbi:MAG: protein translocase subunit SecF [Pseudomonadales bacterium]|nr:protein translocase subunit SecF [Pseudomonadales bacterium]